VNGGFSTRVLAVGLIGAALAFSACGERSSGRGTNSETTEVGSPARKTYSQALYAVDVPAAWVRKTDDEPTQDHLESIWRNPTKSASILIEAEVPPLGGPVAAAKSVRRRVSKSPGYRQLGFEPISLGGRPAARWIFDASGDRQAAYFVDECEVRITVRGSTSPADFDSLAETFRQVASSVSVRCA